MSNAYKWGIGMLAFAGYALFSPQAHATITVRHTECEVVVSTNTVGNGGYSPSLRGPISNYRFNVYYSGGGNVASSHQSSNTFAFTPPRTGVFTITVEVAQNTGAQYINSIGQRICCGREYTVVETVSYRVNQIAGWKFGTLSQYAAIERSNGGYGMAVGANNQVFYAGAGGWVMMYYYDKGWKHAWPTQTWNANEKITGGLAVAKPSNQLFYRGADNKVDTYYWTPIKGWQHAWLTRSWSRSEDVDSGPFTISVGKNNQVAYAGADKWMHLYNYNGTTGQWDHSYLTTTFSSKEKAANVVSASVYDGKVFYKGQDNKMHVYYLDNGRWVHAWLVQNWNNNGEDVGGQIAVNGNCTAVYFTGADGWIHRYYYANNRWNHERLTNSFDPTERHGGTLSVGDGDHVFYRNGSDVRTYYRENGIWYGGYLVRDWKNAAENANANTQVQVGEGNQVFYSDEGGHLNVYHWGSCYTSRKAAPEALSQEAASGETRVEQVSLFPNPTEGRATLTYWVEDAQSVLVEVINLTGQQVLRKEVQAEAGRNDTDLDLTHVVAGIHVVTVKARGKLITSTKLMVVK